VLLAADQLTVSSKIQAAPAAGQTVTGAARWQDRSQTTGSVGSPQMVPTITRSCHLHDRLPIELLARPAPPTPALQQIVERVPPVAWITSVRYRTAS